MNGGACRLLIKRIYCILIRAAIDYGSMVYSSAAKTQRAKVEALRVRSSPINMRQLEMPLEIRRLKLRLRYWTNLKGHLDNHPVTKVMKGLLGI